jgi:hypothetical protein
MINEVPPRDLDPFDLDRFRADPDKAVLPFELKAEGLPKPKRGEPYLGAVPMEWIRRVASLPGRAPLLFFAIWFQVSCAKGQPVTLSARTRQWFALTNRHTYYKALAVLVKAGVVRVEEHRGRRPLLILVTAPPASTRRRRGRAR